ncbi:MAG: serine/threonine-protein kinase [Cyanobacteriota bacterium]|nr:serine/threonine-protein kinase [Cyanobacteriota bacterium]
MVRTKLNYPLIGQTLEERYQIVEILGTGAFGQVYVARDVQSPELRYAIKHYPLHRDHPHLVQMSRRVFATEVKTLKVLGVHRQIPQFIDAFEANQGFYLVQELIVGQTLNDYLTLWKHSDRAQREAETLALLKDILVVLDFIHSRGIIHCDLKPSNLVRRASDGKWVLLDFGNAQPARRSLEEDPLTLPSKPAIAVSPSGYLAAELLAGQPYPNSDIYSLGTIGAEVLTGEDPVRFHFDLDRGEVILPYLREDAVDLMGEGETLEAILQKAIRYNPRQRYRTCKEVLQAVDSLHCVPSPPWLDNLTVEAEAIPADELTVEEAGSFFDEDELNTVIDLGMGLGGAIVPVADNEPPRVKSSRTPVLYRAGMTLAAVNTAAIALGAYALLDVENADPGAKVLSQATQAYHRGQLDEAVALAQSIPADSLSYTNSQEAIATWQSEWEKAAAQFQEIEQALEQKYWETVIVRARKLPQIGFWREKATPLVVRAKAQVEIEARDLLSKAFARAEQRDFTRALGYLEQISPYSEAGEIVQLKLEEYRTKQNIRAKVLLQQAYNRAQQRDFLGAIALLREIPQQTPAGAIARDKLVEYAQKQQIKDRVNSSPIIELQVRRPFL